MKKHSKYLLGLVALVIVATLGTLGGMIFAQGEPTTISNVLTANLDIPAVSDQVALTWAQGDAEPTVYSNTPIDLTLVVGTPAYIWVEAVNNSGAPIDRVQFVIKTDEVFTIESIMPPNTWGGELPFVTDHYYYGPAEGFTMPTPYTVASKFKITPTTAGDYTVQVYAVQLPLP